MFHYRAVFFQHYHIHASRVVIQHQLPATFVAGYGIGGYQPARHIIYLYGAVCGIAGEAIIYPGAVLCRVGHQRQQCLAIGLLYAAAVPALYTAGVQVHAVGTVVLVARQVGPGDGKVEPSAAEAACRCEGKGIAGIACRDGK